MKKTGDLLGKKYLKTTDVLVVLFSAIIAIIGTGIIGYAWLTLNDPPINDMIVENIFSGDEDDVGERLSYITVDEMRTQLQQEIEEPLLAFEINSRPLLQNDASEATIYIETLFRNFFYLQLLNSLPLNSSIHSPLL